MTTIRLRGLPSTKDFPQFVQSDLLWEYDPREVLARLFSCNWVHAMINYGNYSEGVYDPKLNELFPNIYPEIAETLNRLREEMNAVYLPWSRGGCIRAASNYINAISGLPERETYESYRTIQFEVDIYSLIIEAETSIQNQSDVVASSLGQTEISLNIRGLISDIYNAKIDESFHLAFGKHLIDRVGVLERKAKKGTPLGIENYLASTTSITNMQEFYNHYFKFTFDARKWPNPFSNTDIYSNLKMGLDCEEVIARAKSNAITVRGLGLIRSMPVVDAGKVNEHLTGQVISDYPSLFQYLSSGLIDQYYWSKLKNLGVQPDDLGKFKGDELEAFVGDCFANLINKTNRFNRAYLGKPDLQSLPNSGDELADFTIHQQNRCIIGQVKQIGWIDSQEYGTSFDELFKQDNDKVPFDEAVGLLQLKKSIDWLPVLYKAKRLLVPKQKLIIYPCLVVMGEWLESLHTHSVIDNLWTKLIGDEYQVPKFNHSHSVAPLRIITAGELYRKAPSLTYKSAFPTNSRSSEPIFSSQDASLEKLSADLRKRYANVTSAD